MYALKFRALEEYPTKDGVMLDFSSTAFLSKVEETDLALASRGKNISYKSSTLLSRAIDILIFPKFLLCLGNDFCCKFGCILLVFKVP